MSKVAKSHGGDLYLARGELRGINGNLANILESIMTLRNNIDN